mgnify:CR=1 FL=1
MSKYCRTLFSAIALTMAVSLLPGAMTAQAQEKVIKVGALKLIHSITPHFYQQFAPPGYKIEVIPFETPTDSKNAVVTGTVDFATFGIAAAMLGAAAGEPVVIFAPQCNGGMAVVASVKSDIKTIKDLKGKTIGVQTATIHADYAAKYFKDATVKVYDTADNHNADLVAGRIDYALLDSVAADDFVKANAAKGIGAKLIVPADPRKTIPGQFGIRGIPTLILFQDGKKVNELVGNQPKEKIKMMLSKVVSA